MTLKSEPCFNIKDIGESIFLITIKDYEEIDEEQAFLMKDMLLEMSGNQPYKVLLDATNPFQVTSEARKLIAGKEFSETRIAAAFVVTSIANKITGNFFIKINKPYTPVRLFNSMDEAMQWLRSFKT